MDLSSPSFANGANGRAAISVGSLIMFWESLLAGTAVLLSWKIWVALFLYLFLNFVALALGGVFEAAAESGSGAGHLSGCFFMLVGRPLLQGVLMSFFVVFMLPVMLGSPDATRVSDVLALSWPITKAGAIATILVTLLCVLPVVGELVASSVGMQTFITGAVIFRLFFAAVEPELPVRANQSIYPSFWSCLGYLAISAVFVWLLRMLGALVGSCLESSEHDSASAGMAVVIGPVFGIIGGFVPLFMYVQYVKLAVRAG